MTALALIMLCVLAEAALELCFKVSSGPVAAALARRAWLAAGTNPLMWLGILLWAGEMLLWITALEHARLSVAFSLMALTYAVTPLFAWLLLGERLARRQVAGIAMIVCGAAVVGSTGL